MYLIIVMITIATVCSKETISDKIWVNYFDDQAMESHPLNEGFLLLSNNHKKPSSADSYAFFKVDNEHLSKELLNIEAAMDGSGDTTEPTSETTVEFTEPATSVTSSTTTSTSTSSTTAPAEIVLSGYSTFLITLDCINASAIFMDILNRFSAAFSYSYNVTYNITNPTCLRSLNTDVFFTFYTSNNITILTNLFQTLESITSSMGIELNSVNTCGISQIIPTKNPTVCFLIDACGLCGTNPPRGACLPEKNVSRCQCFIDENNPSITYVDEFCKIPKENDVTSALASWVPIVVGFLAGILGLFCVIIICFLIKYTCHRHSQKSKYSNQNEMQFGPQWSLPRVRLPTSAIVDQTYYDANYLIPTSGNTRPNSIHNNEYNNDFYDPIDQLDAILDNELVDLTFYESSDPNNTNSHAGHSHI